MNWHEAMKSDERWWERFTLPELCLDIRMSVNGSLHPTYPYHMVAQAIEYIRYTRDNWNDTNRTCKEEVAFDDKVYEMCEATIALWLHYVPACTGGGCFGGCPHDPNVYDNGVLVVRRK